ncbi:alpha/beta hydrolase [Acinetobacter calcoaceticus]|uniref:alpha/beta hydrolase n=1 Tax=Acinetobacter calcoaceticus TaxID=471 RepID=UPI00196AEE15|nr:alpha/beta hydrolase [Acinetobacter calcoaceticus]
MMNISEYLKSTIQVSLNHKIDDAQMALAQEMRTSYRAMIPSAGTPDPVADVQNILIPATEPARQIPARLYKPLGADNSQKLPMIIFIHGGGFVSGDLDTHDVLVRGMCNGAQAIVLSVDYRLAPEFPFPAALEDVYIALQWMLEQADQLGGDIGRVAVAGDSAGGTLAAALPLLVRDIGEFKFSAQWLIYPETSHKMDTESWRLFGATNFPTKPVNTAVLKAYTAKVSNPYHPLIAPLWGNHENLPPALLQVGEYDPLRDENILYADALTKAGVDAEVIVYPQQMHGFVQFYKDKANNSRGEEALEFGLAFLNRHLNP